MALGFFEIFAIVVAGIIGVVSIVGCCIACICGGNPLCCLGVGVLATLGLSKPRRERQALVIHHAQGGHYQSPPVGMVPSAPPMPVAQGYRYEALPTALPLHSEPSAPPMDAAAVKTSMASRPFSAHLPPENPDNDRPWPEPPRHTGLRDAWALWLFLLLLAVLLCLGLAYGLPRLGVWEKALLDEGEDWARPYRLSASHVLLLCLCLSLVADFAALLWLSIMLRHGDSLVPTVLWGAALGSAALSFTFLLLGLFNAFAAFAVLTVWAVYLLSHEGRRLHLASANLRVACVALVQSLHVLLVAAGALLVQLVWMTLWAIAAVGVYGEMQTDPPGAAVQWKHAGLVLFLSLALYWGQQVIQNVLRCTVVGVVANWFYTPDLQSPVGPSLRRATSLSLGSVCLGSLTVALIATLRSFVQILGSLRCLGACVAWMLDWALACVDAAFRNFNRWAFVYVGTWGYEFRVASHMVVSLFEQRGVDLGVNDYILGGVFWLGSAVIATLTASLGVLSVNTYPELFQPLPAPQVVAALAGFILGLSTCLVLTDVLTSAVDTIFVCYYMDPTALADRRPKEYAVLAAAWKEWETYNAIVTTDLGYDARVHHVYLDSSRAASTTIILPQIRI